MLRRVERVGWAPLRTFATTAAARAAPKPAAPKKKVSVRRGQLTGERRTGGLRRGGVDTSSQLSKATTHYAQQPDMSDLPVLKGASALREGVPGDVLAWSRRTLAAFDAFGLPRELSRAQALQPKPRTIVRQATKDVLQCGQGKHLLIGEPGCGKSTYLLQAVAQAVESESAVLYVPRSIALINSSSPYMYSPAFATYLQPEVATHLLQALLQVNGRILKRIEAPDAHVEGVRVPGGTLESMIQHALADENAHVRQLALEQVLRTLTQQTEVPFVVAIDDVQAYFMTSSYRDPDYVPLEAYELAVPRALRDLVLAPRSQAVVLSALSSAHADFPAPDALLVALREQCSAHGAPVPWSRVWATLSCRGSATRVREPHAYAQVNDTHLASARAAALSPLDVGAPLHRNEAASILDLLHRERVIWTTPNDEAFLAKLVESHGNVHTFTHSWRATLQ